MWAALAWFTCSADRWRKAARSTTLASLLDRLKELTAAGPAVERDGSLAGWAGNDAGGVGPSLDPFPLPARTPASWDDCAADGAGSTDGVVLGVIVGAEAGCDWGWLSAAGEGAEFAGTGVVAGWLDEVDADGAWSDVPSDDCCAAMDGADCGSGDVAFVALATPASGALELDRVCAGGASDEPSVLPSAAGCTEAGWSEAFVAVEPV